MNGELPGAQAALLGIYVIGVIAGLLTIDARPAARVGLAALWPLGPLAFIVTVTFLVAVALVALPARRLRSGQARSLLRR